MSDDVLFDVTFSYHDGEEWVDISNDVRIDGVEIKRGISSGSLGARMAVPGTLTFVVLNGSANSAGVEGYYLPYHLNCREGWGKNARVRVVFEADGLSYTKYEGEITDLVPEGGVDSEYLTVVCTDMLKKLRRKLTLPALARNQTMRQGVQLILDTYELDPAGGLLVEGTMSQSFATIFDIARADEAGLTELAKLAANEMGFIALVGDTSTGERLRLQSRTGRAGLAYKQVPVGNQNASKLVDYDSNYLVDYDGNQLVALEAQEVSVKDKRKTPAYGQNIVNRARVRIPPRRESSELQVLFSLDNTPKIEPGETLEFIAPYSDPTAEAQRVAAYAMQMPFPPTDYTAHSDKDGADDDMTAYLLVDPPEFGVREAKHSLTNTHETDPIYVTKYRVRGYGVYFFRPVDVIAEDIEAGQEVFEQLFSLDYLDDVNEAQEIADDIVAALKTPRLEIPSMEFDLEAGWANYWAAMWLESGDKIPMVDTRFGLNTSAYVQGYSLRERNGAWQCTLTLASDEISTI